MIKVGFIGAGNMGSALLRAAAASGKCELYVYDRDEEKADAVASESGAILSTDVEIAAACDYIFVGVKPNIVPAVAESIAATLKKRENYALISMAAGVSLKRLGELFGKRVPIIRIMPNTPVGVGKGMILWCNNAAVSDDVLEGFSSIMKNAGTLDRIPEELIDAGSAVSGCGPAFVFMFIEAMARAGEECGLSREKALLYTAQTLIGAAEVVKATDKHPNELRDAVCSPGGSTIEGVKVLWERELDSAVFDAVLASYKKTLLLGK